jgi:hypothetical protein
MTTQDKTDEEEPVEETDTTTTETPAPSWADPDGDGKPGISWPAASIVIVIIGALAGMIFADKIPDEVLVLLVGGIGEHVRGKISHGH